MPNSSISSDQSQTEKSSPIVVIPSSLLQYVRSLKLSGTQYDLWLYFYSLDPYGDRWVEAPSPQELAIELGVDPRTVQRAAQRLSDCGLFDVAVKAWKVKNTTTRSKFAENSTDVWIKRSKFGQKDPNADKKIQNPTKRSKFGQKDPNAILEPAPGKGSEIALVPNRDTDHSEQQNRAVPTPHPVTELNSEGIGARELLQLVQDAGINPNKTIRKTIEETIITRGPAAAARAVENALSAVLEQKRLGNCRNPGGMLIAALREGFTANDAKRAARDDSPPPAYQQSPPPDQARIEIACVQALLAGDRAFVLAKLTDLWSQGHHEMVRDICKLYPDWGFRIVNEQLEER